MAGQIRTCKSKGTMIRKVFFTCFLGLLMCHISNAQSTIANIKYEEAEAAFAQNDYQSTIDKLNEAEKLFGKVNPPILYLRIMAQDKILSANRLKDISLVAALVSDVKNYLANYDGIASIEDKYKEVYGISEDIKGYGVDEGIVKSASAGTVNAILAVASFYDRTDNPMKAIQWYKQAAAKGNVKAMAEIGNLYIELKEYALATEWYSKADLKQYPGAAYNLALLYNGYWNTQTIPDMAKAEKYFISTMEIFKNNPQNADAIYYMALLHDRGFGVEKNEQKALAYYKTAAEMGNVEAMYLTASHSYSFVDRDDLAKYRLAMNWYKKAAGLGSVKSMKRVGELFDDRGDFANALKWYKKIYDKYTINAAFNIANLYRFSMHGHVDLNEAVNWLKKVAESNDRELAPIAMSFIADIYSKEAPAQNHEEAFKWYKMAADQGFKDAIIKVIQMYNSGQGVSKDERLAEEWRKKYFEK